MLGRLQFTVVFSAVTAAALALGAVLGLAAMGGRALADATYPDRPIRVIVSVPAGGGVDTITRMVTDKMRGPLGQPLIVENRAGVGGSIAAETVFKADPDGYTLLASQPSPITTNPVLYKSLNYDPTQLVGVAIMSHVPNVLIVRKDFPANSVQELIAYAKANPGKINYASQGIGTTSHLTAELFQTLTHTKLTHVPYKGTAPALTDLMAGHISLLFADVAPTLPLVADGKVRALAETSAVPLPSAPDIPPLRDAGVPGFDAAGWGLVVAPAHTPEPVIGKLYEAFRAVLADDSVRAKMITLGMVPQSSPPPDRLQEFIESEQARWGQAVKDAGLAGTE